jgi:DNA-binding CsgD family transcriptional regulator
VTHTNLQVRLMIAAGHTQPAIGRALGLSLDQVKHQTMRIYRGLGAKNGPHAVAVAFARGYLYAEGDSIGVRVARIRPVALV